MGRKTEPKLTSRERLTRGLRYTAVGPVDVTRGVVGVRPRPRDRGTWTRGGVRKTGVFARTLAK